MVNKMKDNLPEGGIALAFVGLVVPDMPEFHNAAFSRAGQMFQENLLIGLKDAGLPASIVISARPSSSFPRCSTMWLHGGQVELKGSIRVTLLPALNMTPIKQLMIGAGTMWKLLTWGWRNRRSAHRVVYTYNLTVPPGLFTLVSARMIGAKAVVSLCDIEVPGQTVADKFINRLDFRLQRCLIGRFDGHIVVSDAIMHDFAPDRAYLRMEGGIPEALASDACFRRGLEAPRGEFHIGFAGTLDTVNGIEAILESFSQLEGSGYRLRIAGRGPQQQLVERAAAADSRIEYLGMVGFADVLCLYRNVDVLINMRPTKSLKTNYFFPSKMLEYLASGTPVISTCTGHIEEEFGDLCYLLREETPSALAEMIRFVASRSISERQNMGNCARAYVKEHKSWHSQSRKVAQFIREIVSSDRKVDTQHADSLGATYMNENGTSSL